MKFIVSERSVFLGLLGAACILLCGSPTLAQAADPASAAQTASNIGDTVFVQKAAGRVGIGTAAPASALDVAGGEVKIGDSGASCTTKIAGAVRYANSKLQFCDGSGWRVIRTMDKP